MSIMLSGSEPKSPSGEQYRAVVWEWRPLCQLMATTAESLYEGGQLDDVINGEGGLSDWQCQVAATAIKDWIEQTDCGGVQVPSTLIRLDSQGRFIRRPKHNEGHTPYQVTRQRILEFVDFLSHCGGFETRHR